MRLLTSSSGVLLTHTAASHTRQASGPNPMESNSKPHRLHPLGMLSASESPMRAHDQLLGRDLCSRQSVYFSVSYPLCKATQHT